MNPKAKFYLKPIWVFSLLNMFFQFFVNFLFVAKTYPELSVMLSFISYLFSLFIFAFIPIVIFKDASFLLKTFIIIPVFMATIVFAVAFIIKFSVVDAFSIAFDIVVVNIIAFIFLITIKKITRKGVVGSGKVW